MEKSNDWGSHPWGIDEDDHGTIFWAGRVRLHLSVSVRRFKVDAAINMTEKPGQSSLTFGPRSPAYRIAHKLFKYYDMPGVFCFQCRQLRFVANSSPARPVTDQMPANYWLEISPKAKWP